jgi:hypothetical protein
LQAEFALAAAQLPIPTALPPTSALYYRGFCQFFDNYQRDSSETTSEQIATADRRSQEEFELKHIELVQDVLSKTRTLVMACNGNDLNRSKPWKFTTEFFDEYRKIREEVGYENEVADPMHRAILWDFLDRKVREKYPNSCPALDEDDSEDDDSTAQEATTNEDVFGAANKDGLETTDDITPAQDDAPVKKKITRGTGSSVAKPTPESDDDAAPPPIRRSRGTTCVAGKSKEPKTGGKHTRYISTVQDESEDEDEDEDEDENMTKQIPKKHTKKHTKKGKGHTANRNKNDAWRNEERQVVVTVFNKRISAHGLVYWLDNLGPIMQQATDAVNAHRLLDPVTYPGVPREIHAVRSQAHKKPGYQRIRAHAEELKKRMADPDDEVDDEDLKPDDVFKVADIAPARK